MKKTNKNKTTLLSMPLLIKTDDFIIEQDANTPHLHTITALHSTTAQIVFDSILKTRILVGATTTTKTNTNKTKLVFTATSVSQLKKRHSYSGALRILFHLSNQLQHLIENTNHCFLGYSPENTIIVDETKCFYLSTEHLQPIKPNDHIPITFPFSQDDFFLSPELKKIREIPSQVHFKTSYYSLACLILYSLTDHKLDHLEEQEQEQEQEQVHRLDRLPIKETKLYWLLKRCLHENPLLRSIAYL